VIERSPVKQINLDELVLESGSHSSPEDGMCVMEAVAYVAGEPHSDHPKCASKVLTSFLISLNDRWDSDDRQLLKPFIRRLINTATGPEDEETRRWMLADWLIHEYAPGIFRHVGLTAEAERFEQLGAIASLADWQSARGLIYEVRDAQWKRRAEARKRLLKTAAAVAAADAVADADAAAAAAAVADADAAAAAAAVAAAVAAADAVAVAAAAADAVAVAVADADAESKIEEATAAAVAVKKNGGDYWEQRSAAYAVLKPYYDDRYREVFSGELGLKQSVLQLIDRLIAVSDMGKVSA
jgi:hypothetical protein